MVPTEMTGVGDGVKVEETCSDNVGGGTYSDERVVGEGAAM